MSGLSRFNPANRLFGRIFLWFWLATLLMVISSVWVARQLANNYEVESISARELARLAHLSSRLERMAVRDPAANLSLLLGKAGHRGGLMLMLVDEKKQFYYGFPRPMQPDKAPFLRLLQQSEPLALKSAMVEFRGPMPVTLAGGEYRLFVGYPLRGTPLQRLRRQHPEWIFGAALLVSVLLCAGLTWSLLKPIRQLREAVHQMSRGDLSAGVSKVSLRKDELGQLGRDFDTMRERLAALLDGQKRLLADVSHELRSPLARLQVAIGIALQQPENATEDATQKTLLRIEKEAQEIEDMIAQVLRLSRLETHYDANTKAPLEFGKLVAERIDDARFEVQGSDIQIDLSAEPDKEYWLNGEAHLLASAVENLIRNALKYASTKVAVRISGDDGMLTMVIEDDGPGVPDSDLSKIFTPFYRVSRSRERAEGGVGLGLAIAQRAIQFHGGRIEASNGQPHGLTLTITLATNARYEDTDDRNA